MPAPTQNVRVPTWRTRKQAGTLVFVGAMLTLHGKWSLEFLFPAKSFYAPTPGLRLYNDGMAILSEITVAI